jgi:hypothetical protein
MFRALKCAMLNSEDSILTMQLRSLVNQHSVAGSEVAAARTNCLRNRSSFFQTRCIPAPISSCACCISRISLWLSDNCCWRLPEFHPWFQRRGRVRCTRQVGPVVSVGRISSSMARCPDDSHLSTASFVHVDAWLPGESHHTDFDSHILFGDIFSFVFSFRNEETAS